MANLDLREKEGMIGIQKAHRLIAHGTFLGALIVAVIFGFLVLPH